MENDINYEELYNSLKLDNEKSIEELKKVKQDFDTLNDKHIKQSSDYNALKDNYISMCSGMQNNKDKSDDFDTVCAEKFDRKYQNKNQGEQNNGS